MLFNLSKILYKVWTVVYIVSEYWIVILFNKFNFICHHLLCTWNTWAQSKTPFEHCHVHTHILIKFIVKTLKTGFWNLKENTNTHTHTRLHTCMENRCNRKSRFKWSQKVKIYKISQPFFFSLVMITVFFLNYTCQ